MATLERQQAVHAILKQFHSLSALKQLVSSELSYDLVNKPLPRRTWTETAREALAADPVVVAEGGDKGAFHIVYAQLKGAGLPRGAERPVVTKLLEDHPYALFVFSNEAQDRWHFINVKHDEKGDKRRLFRRITVGADERLRTASERLALLDLESINPTLFGIAPLEIQKRHDDAFNVESVTKQFFNEYKAIYGILQNDLTAWTKDKRWAHDYALQFLNRCM
ncbi:MAG: Eco57I restriction-modification methylase domain-containing protein, partial [Pyrinomonadaceae bacterium]